MGILQWLFGTLDDAPAENEVVYVIAPGFEDYVHSLPATGPGGDYGGAVADALIHAGVLIPVEPEGDYW